MLIFVNNFIYEKFWLLDLVKKGIFDRNIHEKWSNVINSLTSVAADETIQYAAA